MKLHCTSRMYPDYLYIHLYLLSSNIFWFWDFKILLLLVHWSHFWYWLTDWWLFFADCIICIGTLWCIFSHKNDWTNYHNVPMCHCWHEPHSFHTNVIIISSTLSQEREGKGAQESTIWIFFLHNFFCNQHSCFIILQLTTKFNHIYIGCLVIESHGTLHQLKYTH